MKLRGLFAIVLIIVFSACTKENTEQPQPNTQTTNSKGELRVILKLYTSSGMVANNAVVNVAATADSLNSGKYLYTMTSDAYGYALFKDISWKKNPTYKVYINASQTDAGKELKGTAEATLQENRTVNAVVVLQ